jgi:RNA polymerase-interacting CarD/CdnL/TRCF family regulator
MAVPSDNNKIFAVGDEVDYDMEGVGIISGIVSQVYEVPYVTLIDFKNERFYAPYDRVNHA